MKRIVIDARELRTSTGRYIERLLHYLQQNDHRHEYVVLLKPADFEGWQPTNPNFRKVACPHKEFTFDEQLGFAVQLYRLKADLVHYGMIQQPILYLKSSVTTMHDLITARFRNTAKNWLVFSIKQQVYKFVIWVAAHKSKGVITPSNYVKEDIVRTTHIKPDKIVVTYEAADKIPEEPQPIAALVEKSYVLYVGRPQTHKNLPRLIEAFDLVRHSHPQLHLVLVGKTDRVYEQLAKYVQDRGIPQVIFTGYVSDASLRWLYEHASAYAFPSLSEGFGLPGLEAMHYDLPVVSSNASCLPEIYGQAALYFNPTDTEDMASKIKLVLDDRILRQQLVSSGRRLLTKYSWRRMAQQTLAVYKVALGE